MSNLVVFDFDGTLIDINNLHKQAWRQVFKEVGLQGGLREYLPPEKHLMERFDSANRIKKYLFSSPIDRSTLEFFFKSQDENYITHELLDLKESHLLHLLDNLSLSEIAALYARNIFPGLDMLLARQDKLGIISNTRETVIISALRVCKLEDSFSFIIGEESMYDDIQGFLAKQHPSVRDKIPHSLMSGAEELYYIGDDIRIDSALARNYGFRFIQVPKGLDFTLLKELI